MFVEIIGIATKSTNKQLNIFHNHSFYKVFMMTLFMAGKYRNALFLLCLGLFSLPLSIEAQTPLTLENAKTVLTPMDTFIQPPTKRAPLLDRTRMTRPVATLRGAACSGTATFSGCRSTITINKTCLQPDQYFSYDYYQCTEYSLFCSNRPKL
jgi:hypothetical protein